MIAEFGSIQANVLTPTCATAGCHVGAAAPQGLKLDAASSFALLVGVPSNQVPALLRVDPGSPDNSYLIQKMEGTAAAGGRMPLNGPPFLDQTTIDVIRLWISNGAPPPVSGTQPPRVVSIEPADGTTLDQLPSEIIVIFSQDMDAAMLSNATVMITRSGGDATFDNGNDEIIQPVGLALDGTNLRRAIIDLTGIVSEVDDYKISLVGTGATALASLSGEILDGNADGQAGGDFISLFSVTAASSTLQSIQDNVFTPTCASSGCHDGPIGPGLPAGQDLSTLASSFASLVGVASVQVPSLLRVNPGNANSSYLVQKLEGTAASGSQMPLGGNPLSQTTIDTIRDWINAGAASGGSDINPPTVALQALASPVSGNVNLSATATDDVAVVQVSFFVDGTLIGSATTAPYQITWDSTTVTDGDHDLTAEAFDAAGNVGASVPQTITLANGIDTTPPQVSLNALASPLSGTVTVSALATDDVGVTQLEFLVDDVLIGTDTVSNFEVLWDTTNVTNGIHELTARAHDAAGNITVSSPLTVTVANDSQPPIVSITSPEDGDDVSGQVLVIIAATDDIGVAEVRLLVNGATVGIDTTSPFEIVWDTTVVADDRYDLVARALDGAGNITDSEIVRADVDNAACTNDPNPPVISLTMPAPGPVGGAVTVSANATDDIGVTFVSFFASGQLIGMDSTLPYNINWDTTAFPSGDINLTAAATDGCNTTVSSSVTVTVSNVAQIFAVSTLSPGDGAIEVDFPSVVVASFNSIVNAATINST
ncbi:MAG: Ig-like domain-containing protein, partial [Gammaproteobacteria bacterium]|nr:Ig-like domain-containing protein [Gammaproteobacteria bacterium]